MHEYTYGYRYVYLTSSMRLSLCSGWSPILITDVWTNPPPEYFNLQALVLWFFQLFNTCMFVSFSFFMVLQALVFPMGFLIFLCSAFFATEVAYKVRKSSCVCVTYSTKSFVFAINTSTLIQHMGGCMQLTLLTYTGRPRHASTHWSATHLHYERICLRQS